jgi:hypothetical protein
MMPLLTELWIFLIPVATNMPVATDFATPFSHGAGLPIQGKICRVGGNFCRYRAIIAQYAGDVSLYQEMIS